MKGSPIATAMLAVVVSALVVMAAAAAEDHFRLGERLFTSLVDLQLRLRSNDESK